MKYVLFYDPAPDDDPEARTANLPEHAALWNSFAGSNRLLMIGPLADTRDGAMGIFTSRAAAEDFAAADPFVRHGVVGGWRVVEWYEALVPENEGPASPPGRSVEPDRDGILRLQAAYADAATRRAWDEVAALFLPGARLHLDLVTSEPRTLEGGEQLAAFVGQAVERFSFFEIAILNSHVMAVPEGSADEAAGRLWLCEVRCGHPGDDGTPGEWSTAFGLYQDRYRRTEDGWRFAERHYRSLARTGINGGVFPLPRFDL